MTTSPDSVTYPQSVAEMIGQSEAAPWETTRRPTNPWDGLFGFATDAGKFEFYDGTSWKNPAWLNQPATFTVLSATTSTTTKLLNIAPGAYSLNGQYSTSTAPLALSMSLPRPTTAPLGKRNIVQWAAVNDVVAPGGTTNQGGSVNFFEIIQRSGDRTVLVTNGVTAAGSATLKFASTTGITAGMFIDDSSGGIPAGATVVSTTSKTVVASAVAVGAGVASGRSIGFRGLVANSWSGSRTITRFTWADDNYPVEQADGPVFGRTDPAVNVIWSTIFSKYNRGGTLPIYRYTRGSNFLNYGMISHVSGCTNLSATRLYEGSLFFAKNTSVRAALGWTVHTPTTDGTAPTSVYNAYTTRKSNNANLSWRGVFMLGDEGFAGIDAMRGTLLGYRSSHADPKPKAFIGVDLADVNFSGPAMRWVGGEISGGAPADAGAGLLRLGNGFLTPTSTGLQIDAVGYRGSPAGTVFSLGGNLVNGDPVIGVRSNSIGDDDYGGTYHFYGPDYANNTFTRVAVLNPPVTNGAAPSNPIEVKLRAPSGAITEFPVTEIATTTQQPTELTATSATAYNGLYCAYYTGVCAGEKQLILGYDPATQILTTDPFSVVPTTAVNLVTNYNFALALPTVENTIVNGWQYTINGDMSLLTNGATLAGNDTLSFASTIGIAEGMVIDDPSGGIPPGSTVLSITPTTVVSSAAAIGAGVASGAPINFEGSGGTGTVVREVDGYISATLTGDGTTAASLDQELTWPALSSGVLRILAAGPYRVKLGTTRGASDIDLVEIEPPPPPAGEDYPRVSDDISFYCAGTSLWLRIETPDTTPARISNVRCADAASGSAILMGVRAGVEAVPLTVNHTWTQRNVLELQPTGGTTSIGGTVKMAAASFAANGGVLTVLTGIGPVGSNTTVQEWLKITNASGVTRYIPCF